MRSVITDFVSEDKNWAAPSAIALQRVVGRFGVDKTARAELNKRTTSADGNHRLLFCIIQPSVAESMSFSVVAVFFHSSTEDVSMLYAPLPDDVRTLKVFTGVYTVNEAAWNSVADKVRQRVDDYRPSYVQPF